jgi:hypothetical protein
LSGGSVHQPVRSDDAADNPLGGSPSTRDSHEHGERSERYCQVKAAAGRVGRLRALPPATTDTDSRPRSSARWPTYEGRSFSGMNLRNLQEGSGGDCLNREGTPVIFGDRPHPILPDGVDRASRSSSTATPTSNPAAASPNSSPPTPASGTPGSASTASCARCCIRAGARRRGLRFVSSSGGRWCCGARSGARAGSTRL